MEFTFKPIAIAHTPFNEKFAIPRQANLAPAALGYIQLLPSVNSEQALDGLEKSRYIWLIFVFHQNRQIPPKPKVRPPRLGGNQSVGVFATRSPYRPCALGQSLVRLDAITANRLQVSGLDLLDGTPILDIKPFIHYSDALELDAHSWAQQAPTAISVTFVPTALEQAQQFEQQHSLPMVALIQQCLAQDPKPAYHKLDSTRIYGCCFWHTNIRFRYVHTGKIEVLSVGDGDGSKQTE